MKIRFLIKRESWFKKLLKRHKIIKDRVVLGTSRKAGGKICVYVNRVYDVCKIKTIRNLILGEYDLFVDVLVKVIAHEVGHDIMSRYGIYVSEQEWGAYKFIREEYGKWDIRGREEDMKKIIEKMMNRFNERGI